MKKLLIIFLLLPAFTAAWAQDDGGKKDKPSTPSPDFPGAIIFEYGLNYLIDPTHEMRTNAWESATYNVYFTYPIKIGESRFAFIPGVGIGTEKFGFEDQVTLYDSLGFNILAYVADVPPYLNISEVTKTQFIVNYLDFPMEFRIHSRKDDHKRSLFFGVGGKIGVNIGAKTKVKYSEYGAHKVNKNKYSYNVNTFRFGALARFGYGPFSAWFYYGGNDLFQGNKSVNYINTNMWSFGISLATF